MLAWGEGYKILTKGQKELGYDSYENHSDRGIQIHYTNAQNQDATVSIINLSDVQLNGALEASGNNAFVKETVDAIRYLRYPDISTNRIILKLAKSKREVHIRKAKPHYDHYVPRDRFSKFYPENNEAKGVYWDPKSAVQWPVQGELNSQTPAMGLYFEMGHAYMQLFKPILFWALSLIKLPNYGDAQERLNLKRFESTLAQELFEGVRPDIVSGTFVTVSGPLEKP